MRWCSNTALEGNGRWQISQDTTCRTPGVVPFPFVSDWRWSLPPLLGVALEYEATLSKEQVSVDLQSPLPENPEVKLGDITPWEADAVVVWLRRAFLGVWGPRCEEAEVGGCDTGVC